MRARLFIAVALIAAAAASGRAAETRLVATPASRLVLQGWSNVAPWRCSGSSFEGRVEVAAPLERINAVIDRIEDGQIGVFMANPAAARFPTPRFELRLPVSGLRCGNRQMERDMYRALDATTHPVIEFRSGEMIGGVEHDIDSGTYRARFRGLLTLAGERRNVEIDVTAERTGQNRFRLRAALPLRMTDFGITPPTALKGVIRARNELTVRFDVILEPAGNDSRT